MYVLEMLHKSCEDVVSNMSKFCIKVESMLLECYIEVEVTYT